MISLGEDESYQQLTIIGGEFTYMHTCPPPTEALDEWLHGVSSTVDRYGHLLLEQHGGHDAALVAALRPYFESAHLDARTFLHAEIGIDLHPDAEDDGANAQYPACLPTSAKRGLFGEVLAGLITESYEFIGDHDWTVPVFLFRHHAAAEKYLFDLARNPDQPAAVFGRLGTDFLGLSLDENGAVVRFIAGEAKWRQKLTTSIVEGLLLGNLVKGPKDGPKIRSGKGIWRELNKYMPIPHGARQLQHLLEELDPEGYAATIVSLDRALIVRNGVIIPRTNLVIIAGNGAAKREEGTCLIGREKIPDEYTSRNDLQVVEVILENGEDLIDTLYNSLWTKADDHAPA